MFNELQTTSLDHLARARHGDHPVFPLAGHMFTVAADQARDIGDPRPDAERRGTGGGNLRAMYARFLAECGRPEAELAADAARRWTERSAPLLAASEAKAPEPELWRSVGELAGDVLAAEERLWPALLSEAA